MKQEVHIYWVLVPDTIQVKDLLSSLPVLDTEEQYTFDRYRVDFKKIEFLTGRLLLKTLLGALLDKASADVRFVKNEYGKLFLDPKQWQEIEKVPSFNLSHAGQLVVMAITAQGDLGVDVEETSRDHLGLMPSVFTPSEIAYVNEKETAEQKKLAFYELWTRKEAYVKAKGPGLSILPTSFTVPFGTNRAIRDDFEYHTFQPLASYILSTAMACREGNEYHYNVQKINFTDLFARPLG